MWTLLIPKTAIGYGLLGPRQMLISTILFVCNKINRSTTLRLRLVASFKASVRGILVNF